MAGVAKSESPVIWIACILVGLSALGLGFAWPFLSAGRSEEAKSSVAEFLEAGKAMETASATGSKKQSENLSEVRERYRKAREKAEQVRAAPGRTAYWLKVAGGLLAAIGCAGYFATGKN